MTESSDERSVRALALRETDPEAWERLPLIVRDLAQIYADVEASRARNVDRDAERDLKFGGLQ